MIGILENEGKKRPVIVCDGLADIAQVLEWKKALKEVIEMLLLLEKDSHAEALFAIAEEMEFSEAMKEVAIDAYFKGVEPLSVAMKHPCTLSI